MTLYNGDYNAFFNNTINYYISELQKGNNNIKIDLDYFEKKYSMNSEEFYSDFEKGNLGDINGDFIQWGGEYEIYLENERKLSQLL
jgi:hypothetical protein